MYVLPKGVISGDECRKVKSGGEGTFAFGDLSAVGNDLNSNTKLKNLNVQLARATLLASSGLHKKLEDYKYLVFRGELPARWKTFVIKDSSIWGGLKNLILGQPNFTSFLLSIKDICTDQSLARLRDIASKQIEIERLMKDELRQDGLFIE